MLLLLAFSCNPTQPSVAIAAPSATAPSVSMDRFMREFMDLHNCNAPTPLTQYVSEKGLTTRSIPTQGQQINNFCYDNWSIVSYNPTRSGTEVVATIAGSSYCHELTYKVIEEAGGYRLVPGNWHSDVSYVDPWISERRDISDSTCPSSSGSTTTTGGVNASSPREFMNGFMDLNNCNGTGLEYLSSSHMTSRSIPTYGIEVNNFCYDSWSITSEQATGQGTNFTATIGNEYYCHALTYTVVGSSGSYSLIPGTYHSDTSFVDPWVSESRDVTDPSCANSTAAPTTTTTTSGSGTDSFIENFL